MLAPRCDGEKAQIELNGAIRIDATGGQMRRAATANGKI
jgi:hypothetical protein